MLGRNKKSITKEILQYLLISGAICVAASSTYFWWRIWLNIFKKKYPKKRFNNTFDYLRKRGLIEIRRKNHDIEIALSEKGREKTIKLQIDELKIKKPEKWDEKWRIVIFDIMEVKKIIRNAFRRKLKELGFYPLQKSVWVCPYPCEKEIGILRKFLGVGGESIKLIVAEHIENDGFLRKFFDLELD